MEDIEFWAIFVTENSTLLQKLVLEGETSLVMGSHLRPSIQAKLGEKKSSQDIQTNCIYMESGKTCQNTDAPSIVDSSAAATCYGTPNL